MNPSSKSKTTKRSVMSALTSKTTKPKKKAREWTAWATIAHDGKSLEWVMLPGDSAKHYIVTDKKDRGEDCIQVTITEVGGRRKGR